MACDPFLEECVTEPLSLALGHGHEPFCGIDDIPCTWMLGPHSLHGDQERLDGGESSGASVGVSWWLLPPQCLAPGAVVFNTSLRHLAAASIFSLLRSCFWSKSWSSIVGGSISLPIAVFLSSCRVVVRALLAAANRADLEHNQFSWHAFHSMSGLDAFFLMHVAMVLRHVRTVYNTRRVCSLCPKIAS